MKRMLAVFLVIETLACVACDAQKKYGYTVLQFRCGDNDAERDRLYYSPVIELNTLNFARYTEGIDPAIPQYSVRYYNYAIAKWFENYLSDKYKVFINTPGKYARKSKTVIFNERNKADCNDTKTSPPCFFLSQEELAEIRKSDIAEQRGTTHSGAVCEVTDLH
jgi:hypothetical protein